MTRTAGSSCCVCNATDARSLVAVTLVGGARATLCGSHALMHRRSTMEARSTDDLRVLLGERRRRRERRSEGDALGAALSAAFARQDGEAGEAGERRAAGRRRA